MTLISPEVLAELNGLSPGAGGFLIFVGLLLWTLGWRWHRFWIVFALTTAAGTVGLNAGRAAGGHVLVIGLLLAFAGGVMALELAKILSFVAGGVGAWLTVQAALPQAQEMWAVFLAGGLMGVILHRLWTMLLTSLLGVLLVGHTGLILLAPVLKIDPAKWVAGHAAAVNGAAVALAVLGVLVQAKTAEGPAKKAEEPADKKKDKEKKKKPEAEPEAEPAKARGWWPRLSMK